MQWYVSVDNQAYGPYSDGQMHQFVIEGRVTPHSLISSVPEQGFYGANQFDAYNIWCGAQQLGAYQDDLESMRAVGAMGSFSSGGAAGAVNTKPRHSAPVQLEPVQPAPEHITPELVAPVLNTNPAGVKRSEPTGSNSKSCVYLIMAEIKLGNEMAFLQAVQSFGQTERIGDAVWLVRSTHTTQAIRNTLSQILGQQDRLFILEGGAGNTAWFNIGADLDHRIRKLWDEDEG